jgi:hypothetical protein
MKKIFTLLCCMALAAQCSLVSAQKTTTMEVWQNGYIIKTFMITNVDSVTFGKDVHLINGYRFVDLGLPSGLLWAETNVGATCSPEDGYYFAWGETDTITKSEYNWLTYKFADIDGWQNLDGFLKYNASDNKTTLDKEDDAAYVNWGSPCRMPTKEEFAELRDSSNCTWTWISMLTPSGSSIKGHKVTSVRNGNSIFLPASGYHYYEDYYKKDQLYVYGIGGRYWSSSLNYSEYYELEFETGKSHYGAYQLYFLKGSTNEQISEKRFRGCTVRAVAEP